MRNLIILGIDPGTTVSYSAIDLDGNLVKTNSSKLLDLNSLISEVSEIGKVILVGTDKKNCPVFVEKAAIQLGAKIICPQEDLLVREKQELATNIKLKDSHQTDAFASAKYAYSTVKPLLKKIRLVLENNSKIELLNEVSYIVIKKGLSIRKALAMLEPKKAERIEEAADKELSSEELLHMLEKLRKKYLILKKENIMLREHLHQLKERKPEVKTVVKSVTGKELRQKLKFREQRIILLEKKISEEAKRTEEARKTADLLRNFISEIDSRVIAKKLDNLGLVEFEKKNKLLKIKEGDVILVDDPAIVSEEVVKKLRGSQIVAKKQFGKNLEKELNLIPVKNLVVLEETYFALIDKKALDRENNKKELLEKVIKSYKDSRS